MAHTALDRVTVPGSEQPDSEAWIRDDEMPRFLEETRKGEASTGAMAGSTGSERLA